MSKTFAPDTRVSELVKDRNSNARKGKVISEVPGSPGLIMVEWDGRWQGDKTVITKVPVQNLCLETEAIQKESQLDLEFANLEAELSEKLEAAASLIAEAAKIASDHGEVLSELSEANYPLVGAMRRAGWNTSSWNC